MLEKETERELTGPTKPTMKSRCFLMLDDGSEINQRKHYFVFQKSGPQKEKKSTRSDLLRVCLYLQGTVFSLLKGGF